MSRVFAVVELHHFLDQFRLGNQACLLHFVLNGQQELLVAAFLHFDVGEEIIEERVEERDILSNEFGNVHVVDGSHQDQYLLAQLLLLQLFDQLLIFLIDLVKRALDVCLSTNGSSACKH